MTIAEAPPMRSGHGAAAAAPISSSSPSLSYVICTAPRTGSTLLAEALASTDRAGKPNEYFDIYDYNEQYWVRSLNIPSEAEYFDRVVASTTTGNGVFGLKLLWHQSPALLKKLRASLDEGIDPQQSLHDLWCAKLGEPRYVWLRRKNKLAQAISYYRASRTGLWRSVDDRSGQRETADRELPFDAEVIARYLRAVDTFDTRWHEFFRQHRQRVLMIVYEDFVQSFAPTVASVFDFLGIPRDGVTLAPPRLQQQSDARSIEWEERFRSLQARSRLPAEPQPAEPSADPKPVDPPPAAKPAAIRRGRAARNEAPLPFVAYSLSHDQHTLVTAKPNRDWMDATPKRFAYRCLPMVIANQAGWLILNRHKFAVTWNGGVEPDALKIHFLSGTRPRSAVSIFGSGILTFLVGYLFRTPPGYNLYVHGPANLPKDGIGALEGIVEADWTEATFTMNWKVTRLNHPIVFEEGEPIAMVTPLQRHDIERFRPEIQALSADPALEVLHREWASSRERHNADLKVPNSAARKEGWQRHYMRGTSIRKEPAPMHQTSLSIADFVDKRT